MTQSMTTSFLSAGIVPMTDEAGFTYRFNAACRLFGAQPNADLRARLMAVVCQAREGPDADTLTITNTLYPDLDTQTALALFKALSYGMRFTKIRIHDIQLKDTGMNAALQAISRHPGVTVLEMRKTGATVASVPLLRSVLLRDPPLQSYDISCNDLEEAGMILVADVVACTKRPQESLTVARLKSQALGTGRLLQSIQHNVVLVGSLRSLDLSGNTIGPAAADSLSSLFAMDAWRLERLFVNNCQISDEGVAGCLVAAARCPTLKELSVSKNAFGDVIAVQLCAGIAANPTLEVLNVSFLKVSARAIEALVASAFRSERQRMEMDISGNDLGDYVGVKIASILSESRIVHSLAADHCELGHAAISWILKGLTGGPIARLSLSSNVLDNEGDDDDEALANALRDFVRSTPLLSELLLADNSTTKAHMRLDPMLSELKTGAPALTALDIQGNAMGDEGMMALADAIKANHTLTSLQLDQNNTKVAGLQCLADAIEANDTLVRMPFPTRDYKFALQAATNHELVKQIPSRIDRKLADNMARLQHT
ncbi:hypothetical protein PBRA_006943 [Plasmodiophora brassicae]|nr:hypothetical protein PBRA_006943 [Plasmodiophora brassicae]